MKIFQQILLKKFWEKFKNIFWNNNFLNFFYLEKIFRTNFLGNFKKYLLKTFLTKFFEKEIRKYFWKKIEKVIFRISFENIFWNFLKIFGNFLKIFRRKFSKINFGNFFFIFKIFQNIIEKFFLIFHRWQVDFLGQFLPCGFPMH